jgi:hypothetical protein
MARKKAASIKSDPCTISGWMARGLCKESAEIMCGKRQGRKEPDCYGAEQVFLIEEAPAGHTYRVEQRAIMAIEGIEESIESLGFSIKGGW